MQLLVLYILKFFSYLVFISPRSWQMFYGDLFGYLWFDILRVRRDFIDSNLLIAFPDMDRKTRIQIGRESCRNMGRGLIDYFLFPHITKENADKYFVCESWDKFEKVRAQNKGVLLLSLHLGSYDFLSVYLALKGMDLRLISKEMKLKKLNDLWFALRESKGLKFIPDRKARFEIIKGLKEKASVAFIIDQFTGPPIGIRTTFFGKETGTAYGLALFQAWRKAPVLPIYNYRRADNKIEVVFGDEITLEEQADRDATVAFMTQKYNTVLEDVISRHPGQWLWVHKRWKEFKY
ncbi:MAG: lysophospholipid acyltransferase family protein [Bdellovibrionales bacterium]